MTESKGIPIQGLFSRFYDRLTAMFGYGEAFTRKMVDEASLRNGEEVLDCGCGTGALAIMAKQIVGEKGRVSGLDLSCDQLQMARRKTQKAGLEVGYYKGSIDDLPFPDASFDVVFCTMTLQYHVPLDVKRRAFHEMRRVLRKGGRLIIADFGPPAHLWGWIPFSLIVLKFLSHSWSRNSLFKPLSASLSEAGIQVSKEYVFKQYIHVIIASY
ncbi:MAG: class I SAM-dependent methyltransferase [Candidatus Abyssobacteria bacterium SURF_5]|jgi:ubiquinone/menaquinone biosynthesis C-methylase UbiE|uniref:Class I SAM-dependent methyltransferase n=1 Tax=Abyssobacteria bacterium (strain SURF_5) TaxID=2093360 RepID=A0A3A4P0B1_ABYX5|nr:MAG: class I SAM-dependent methyltransferase [Candidatus Abyssubacteria bacterium SURF_5]